MGVAIDSILQPMQRKLLMIRGRGSNPPPQPSPAKGEGIQRKPGWTCVYALGPVDIHRSQITAPTRNSMEAKERAVFS